MSTIFFRFLAYLLVLFQLIIEVKSQKAPFKLSKRAGHTATLIDSKLYVLGGYSLVAYIEDEISGQEFFYLDVSETFTTTKEIKWVNLTNINLVPSHRWAASVKGGVNNNTLFLYGGRPYNGEMALVHTFDTQNNLWNIPKITENYHPLNKNGLAPIIDDSGRVYLFGGHFDHYNDKNNYVDDITILDTVNLRIEKGNSNNAPTSRGYYGAVLLQNQKIIYIGGSDGIQSLPLDKVYIYDITSDEWSYQITGGLIPSDRNAFTAVLGLDGQRVIVYGGLKASDSPIPVEESLYVLDVNNWKWDIPKVSGNPPPVSFAHKTIVIGKYMVITFGNSINGTVAPNEVSLLDISNNDQYKWSNIFTPHDTKKVPTTLTNNLGVLVGVILSSLAGCTLLTVGCFFLYKKRKNTQLLDLTIRLSEISIPDFD